MKEQLVQRRTLVQGISTVYYQAGEGPVVLLIHGNVTSPRDWWPTMKDLASTNRVIALALPGYGDTSPLDDIGAERLVAFVKAFLDELGVEQVIAVGHSLGGQLVTQLALAHPDRVARLVLANASGLGHTVNPIVIATGLVPRPLAELMITALLMPGGGIARVLVSGLQLRRPWNISLRILLEQIRLTHRRSFLRTSYEVVRVGVGLTGQRMGRDLVRRLGEIQVPALVIWSVTDQMFPLWQGIFAARRLPRGSLAIIYGAGHVTYIDSYQQFIDVLGPFVRDVPRGDDPDSAGTLH